MPSNSVKGTEDQSKREGSNLQNNDQGEKEITEKVVGDKNVVKILEKEICELTVRDVNIKKVTFNVEVDGALNVEHVGGS